MLRPIESALFDDEIVIEILTRYDLPHLTSAQLVAVREELIDALQIAEQEVMEYWDLLEDISAEQNRRRHNA